MSFPGDTGKQFGGFICEPFGALIDRLGHSLPNWGASIRTSRVAPQFLRRRLASPMVTRTDGLSCITASGENWTPTEGATAVEEPA